MPMSRAPEPKATRLETLLLRELRACWLYRSVPVGASLCSCCHGPVRVRRRPNLVKTRRTRVWKPVVRELCIRTRVDNLNEHVSRWERVFLFWCGYVFLFSSALFDAGQQLLELQKRKITEREACNIRENRFDSPVLAQLAQIFVFRKTSLNFNSHSEFKSLWICNYRTDIR